MDAHSNFEQHLRLFGEGLELHIPKGYIYFAMAFSVVVEMINLKVRAKAVEPVHLRKALSASDQPA